MAERDLKIRQKVDELIELYEGTLRERASRQPDTEKIGVQEKAIKDILVDLGSQVLIDINRIANSLESLVRQGRL